MKEKNNQLLRFQTMLENDRVVTTNNFVQLVCLDVEKVLKEYFDFRVSPQLILQKVGSEYEVKIALRAKRIKNFANIPK
ncbi:MAG: hypothetical protein E7348_06425 [Clostridiales bacterium]|nr:hypothetical protein [Clostridiales bacterium]